MTMLRSKFAAWVVAVALVAANHVCACATWLSNSASAPDHQQPTAAMQPDHSCCRPDRDASKPTSNSPAPDPTHQGDPCERCNIRAAAPTTPPEPLHPVAQLDLLPWPALASDLGGDGTHALACNAFAANPLIPPLLADLFHSHCLLTN